MSDEALLSVPSRMFIDHFSGPGRSVGPVCVCLYVWTMTFEVDAGPY